MNRYSNQTLSIYFKSNTIKKRFTNSKTHKSSSTIYIIDIPNIYIYSLNKILRIYTHCILTAPTELLQWITEMANEISVKKNGSRFIKLISSDDSMSCHSRSFFCNNSFVWIFSPLKFLPAIFLLIFNYLMFFV